VSCNVYFAARSIVICGCLRQHFYFIFPYLHFPTSHICTCFLHFPPLHNRTWHNRILDFSVLAFSYALCLHSLHPLLMRLYFIYAIVPHAIKNAMQHVIIQFQSKIIKAKTRKLALTRTPDVIRPTMRGNFWQ